jgi:hypothetical protein
LGDFFFDDNDNGEEEEIDDADNGDDADDADDNNIILFLSFFRRTVEYLKLFISRFSFLLFYLYNIIIVVDTSSYS